MWNLLWTVICKFLTCVKTKIWTDMHSWRLIFKQLKVVVRVLEKIWEKTQHLIYKKENKSCDNFNWMSYIKNDIYICKLVLRTYISLAGSPSPSHLLRDKVKVIMTGRWPKVTLKLCPKVRSIKLDLSLNPIRHAPDSNQNKKQVRSYR